MFSTSFSTSVLVFNGRFLSPSIGLGSVYDTCRSDGVFHAWHGWLVGNFEGLLGAWWVGRCIFWSAHGSRTLLRSGLDVASMDAVD